VTRGAAAGRYARALFDVVLRETPADLDKILTQLEQFSGLFTQHPALASAMGNPAVPISKKAAVAKALIDRSAGMAAPLAKLVVMLAERDRLMLLADIVRIYRERLMDQQQIVRGEVTTAIPVSSEKLRALEQGLERATGRKVVLETKVDPSIIGGVVTRLGSTIYDGSVTTQLRKMKQALIEAGQ
jgi:F-type H+-transporting ATPase subunit delta